MRVWIKLFRSPIVDNPSTVFECLNDAGKGIVGIPVLSQA
jgi:hypothetical protein